MPDKLSKDEIVAKAKKCFKAASEAEEKQRQRERDDLAFQVPDNQWDPEAKRFRKGTNTAPGRPMLSVSLLSQPMALIQNQAVAAHLGVEIHPVSEAADPEVAEVKQGLYRRIERDSNAQVARLWALDRAKQCGRGWYRVNTQWDEDGDDPFDQEIVIERILNQENVYVDPSSQKADFSDATWALLVSYVPVSEFEEQYPDAQAPQSNNEFKAWEGSDPEWVRGEGENKAVLVAEFWWKTKAKGEELVRATDKLKRQKERTVVNWALLTAREVLEQIELDGQYIPLVPVIGTELQPFDGQRIWEGMVRKARDAQKFFNFSISTLVERMAMEPKAPFVGAEGQFKGHEEEWQLANVRNQPYLEYSPTSFQGNLNPPPIRAQIDSSGMSVALMALDQARQFVQTATSVYAPSLGQLPTDQSKQSGRAIIALQQQSDAGTSHFLQQLADISMQYEARVVLDLMQYVYDRPGRVVQILGTEDEPRTVMLNAPHVEDKDGLPQRIPAGMPPPPNVKVYDLARGKYTVSVSVGKSFQTRLQEGATEIGQVLQAAPQLMPLIGPTYFRFRDFPGAQEIADVLKKVREKQFPGLDGQEGEQPSPEQLQGQIQQMGQQLQMAQQQLQMAMQKLQTDQVKQEATLQKAQMDNQTRLQIAQMENESKLVLERLWTELESMKALLQHKQTQDKLQSAEIQAGADRLHEAVQANEDRAHAALIKVQPPYPQPEPQLQEPLEVEQ